MRSGLIIIGVATLALSGCAPAGGVDSAPSPAIPSHFRAIGTEPFWGMRVAERDVRYSTPEIPESVAQGVIRRPGRTEQTVTGRLGSVGFTLTIRTERCSDGMSDRVYPFAVRLSLGDQALQGCAAAE